MILRSMVAAHPRLGSRRTSRSRASPRQWRRLRAKYSVGQDIPLEAARR
jgi:hypothetical protein